MVTDPWTKSLLCVKAAAGKKAFDLVLLEMKKLPLLPITSLSAAGNQTARFRPLPRRLKKK
jgi:hypothetical protein